MSLRSAVNCMLFMVAMATLSGCNMAADTSAAEREVERFHLQLDNTNLAEIYDESTDELKAATSEKDFVAFLAAVHRKLGVVKRTERQHLGVNYNTAGSFVTLAYKTDFTEGEANEQFTYRLDGSSAKLFSYNVNSNVFIIK